MMPRGGETWFSQTFHRRTIMNPLYLKEALEYLSITLMLFEN